MIAFYGYDGFLYSIGYLAGWVVALFVVAEPMKRLGKYTFADALDSRFQSRSIKLAAGSSTLAVSIFYLIPQMVGAGVLVRPLFGMPHWAGRDDGRRRGDLHRRHRRHGEHHLRAVPQRRAAGVFSFASDSADPQSRINGWRRRRRYARACFSRKRWLAPAMVRFWSMACRKAQVLARPTCGRSATSAACQTGSTATGPLGPLEFLRVFAAERGRAVEQQRRRRTTASPSRSTRPSQLRAARCCDRAIIRRSKASAARRLTEKLNFLSLMLALFCGTASLPHILIRYYTVKDQTAARKSTIVGIASIGFFYILTLYMGLGAMTSGAMDVTNSNMAAPLLARSFNEWLFAIISAIAFTTVLGTVSGLIIAASGAVVHDLLVSVGRVEMNDHNKVRVAKIASVGVGAVAIVLGILFEKLNVNYLVGWAFSVAASANFPALMMLLFWPGVTKQGIAASVLVGMVASLAWILASGDTFRDVYGLPADAALVPFSQPGIVTIPLGFLTLVAVSLLTRGGTAAQKATAP